MTVYLLKTKVPKKKPVKYGLLHVYGLGTFTINFLLKKLGFAKNYKVFELNSKQIYNLTYLINKSKIYINMDLKRLSLNFKKKYRKKILLKNGTKSKRQSI